MSPLEILTRKRRQVSRKKKKDMYVNKCLSGELPLKKCPIFLQNQIRGLRDEANSGLECSQKRVRINCGWYDVMGSIDGIVEIDGVPHVCEYKSRSRFWVLPIRDRIQVTVYAIALGMPALLRQQLGEEIQDTVWSLEECERFWKDILPVLDESMMEFKHILEGKVNNRKRTWMRFWLRNSNH